MRIIGGDKKGLLIQAPKGLPVRPTTDRAKESLFNILENRLHLDKVCVLDLFAGTGNMSFEFASRNALQVLCVDQDFGCINFIKKTSKSFGLNQIEARKQDVFTFLNQNKSQFDVIFADPPYGLSRISELAEMLSSAQFLKKDGLLIIEHATLQDLSFVKGFEQRREYGQSTFSFFSHHGD